MFKSLFKNKDKAETKKTEVSTVSAVIKEKDGETNVELHVSGCAAHFLDVAAGLILNVAENTDVPAEIALMFVTEKVINETVGIIENKAPVDEKKPD